MAEYEADLLVIGGGINGVGIARDAAGRGLSVVLCERGDIGGATSSASTKLVHGGLRYLEHFAFGLVRESLSERERLLANAPHLVRPMRFVLPLAPGRRPAWLIRLGLLFYDRFAAGTRLPASASLRLREDRRGAPLKEGLTRGFAYTDCWVDDARLVVLNAVDARARGAEILPRTAFFGAESENGRWRARLEGDGAAHTVRARVLVNAAGPWVAETAARIAGAASAARVRLIKGSHIVTPRLYDGDHAYILQNADGRVVFAIPYEHAFTLIGTTEQEFHGDAAAPSVDEAEVDYLCRAVGAYFCKGVTPADVVWRYSGVRALYDDGRRNPSSVSREWRLDIDRSADRAIAMAVYGGKLTTYRNLGERAVDRLSGYFDGQVGAAWTADATLPGGDLGGASFGRFAQKLAADYAGLDAAYLRALAARHGTRVYALLGDARRLSDLGRDFGGGLFEIEADWLVREEWAREAADILWRRTKTGLHGADENALADWLSARRH